MIGRHALGRYLLRRLIAEAGNDNKALTLSTAKMNPAVMLYERLGFVAVGESKFKTYMLRAPTLGEIEIREAAEADIPAIRAVHNSAFGRTNEGELVAKLHVEGLIAVSIVAISDGHIVGNAVFSRLTVQAPCDSVSVLALAPVSVATDYQSRGIASRIIRYGLAICKHRRYDAVLVLGDPGYYERFGFSCELARNVRSPYTNYGRHWMALELRKSSISRATLAVAYPQVFQEVD